MVAWMRRYRNMASEFQRPRRRMMSGSILAQRRAVAPPGRKDRVDSKAGVMPVWCWTEVAACRRAFVTKVGLVGYHFP